MENEGAETKVDHNRNIWIEELTIEVDGQVVRGETIHVSSKDIIVLIQSPFQGFYERTYFQPPYFSMSVHPGRETKFDGDWGTQTGKSLLEQLYLKHKDYAENRPTLTTAS